MKMTRAAVAAIRTITATPIPMPAFAPVERLFPLCGDGGGGDVLVDKTSEDDVESDVAAAARIASSECCHMMGTPSPKTTVPEAIVDVDTTPRSQPSPVFVGLI